MRYPDIMHQHCDNISECPACLGVDRRGGMYMCEPVVEELSVVRDFADDTIWYSIHQCRAGS